MGLSVAFLPFVQSGLCPRLAASTICLHPTICR